MLNVKTETIVREVITDCRNLSLPECHYLIGAGWYEFFNDKTKNDTDGYDLDELNIMNDLYFHFFDGWGMRCNPNDYSVTITIGEIGWIDIVPKPDGSGIEVSYWGENEFMLYTCSFTVEELIEIEIVEI